MRILIIGGNRYTGKMLAFKFVLDGHQVTCMNRSGIAPVGCASIAFDRRVTGYPDYVKETEFDHIIDFCAYTESDATTTINEKLKYESYTLISSGAVYNDRFNFMRTVKDEQRGGDVIFGEYGVGKHLAEEAFLKKFSEDLTPVRIIRAPYILGSNDPAGRIQNIVYAVKNGSVSVEDVDRYNCASLIWDTDYVDALFYVISYKEQFGIYNISGDEVYSYASMLDLIAKQFGRIQYEASGESSLFRFKDKPYLLKDNTGYKHYVGFRKNLENYCLGL